jgi:hypothetical protein
MRTWFRDRFIDSFATQKLGGFDPYLNEYVLSINNQSLPLIGQCVDCGISQFTTVADGDILTYCVNVGSVVGTVNINYEVDIVVLFTIQASYNGVVVSSGEVDESGVLVVDKNLNDVDIIEIQITPSIAGVPITVTTNCPVSDELSIVEVCVTSSVDAGQFIHNEYRYTNGTYVSPLQSNLVTFSSGTTNPLVSRYNIVSGAPGLGGFPPAGSTMRLASNKINFDDFVFDALQDKFLYYRSDILYGNTPSEIADLLAAASLATPIAGASPYYYADFIVPSVGQYLYIIWDYRNALAIELCYSDVDESDACCGCAPTGDPLVLCYSDVDESDACCGCVVY